MSKKLISVIPGFKTIKIAWVKQCFEPTRIFMNFRVKSSSRWKYFRENIFAKTFFMKIFSENISARSQHATSHSFVYRTSTILRLLGPGIAEMRKSAHFQYFNQNVRFKLKCKKCFIFILLKNQLLRPPSRNIYRTHAILRLLGATLLEMQF